MRRAEEFTNLTYELTDTSFEGVNKPWKRNARKRREYEVVKEELSRLSKRLETLRES